MPDTSNLRTLIAQNKIGQALELLKKETTADNDLQTQIALLAAKWNDTRKKENLGLIERKDAALAYNQVNYAVLEMIGSMESSAPPADKKVFISYNHGDTETANLLREKLQQKSIPVIIDSEQMKAGDDIRGFIEASVRDSDVTVSIVSKKSLYSAWVAMESVNTFYHQKVAGEKKFIGCYIEDDFFSPAFTDKALDDIEQQISDMQALIRQRIDKNRNIRDLQNELERLTDLRNNFDKIIQRLRESLCIDIRNGIPENNFNRIVEAIRQ